MGCIGDALQSALYMWTAARLGSGIVKEDPDIPRVSL